VRVPVGLENGSAAYSIGEPFRRERPISIKWRHPRVSVLKMGSLHSLRPRSCLPPVDIDDLLQDIFLVLDRHWPTLGLARPLRPWLFGVAFRVVRSHRRRRAREAHSAGLDPNDTSDRPERQLERQEPPAILWVTLEHVPSRRRFEVVKHDLEGLEIVDIASQLSMTKFGVYARLYKDHRELASEARRLVKAGVPT